MLARREAGRANRVWGKWPCLKLHLPQANKTTPSSSRGASQEVLTMVVDHGTIRSMDEIPISKFKATCLATLKRVKRTRKPVRVTRFGEPMADIMPPGQKGGARRMLGSMKGTVQIHGDIVGPVGDESDWEAAR